MLDKIKEISTIVDTTYLKTLFNAYKVVKMDESKNSIQLEIVTALDNIEQYFAKQLEIEAKLEIERRHPVYFDILVNGRITMSHLRFNSEMDLRQSSAYRDLKIDIIRSYNRNNQVVYENEKLAGRCINYNDLYAEQFKKMCNTINNFTINELKPTEDKNCTNDTFDDVELTKEEQIEQKYFENMAKHWQGVNYNNTENLPNNVEKPIQKQKHKSKTKNKKQKASK